MRRLLALVLAAGLLAAGCGDDDNDDGGGSAAKGAPTKTSDDAKIEGADGRAMVKVATELLDAESGEDPCFAIVASDYVESLGGLDGCAKKLTPLVTGPLDTITAARPLKGGETGEVQVESSDGSQEQTIKFAKTVSGDWRVDGLGG